jgi:hypothetical protein
MTIGYKIAYNKNTDSSVLVTLEIPQDAKTNMNRPNIFCAQKARYKCNKCKVLEITDLAQSVRSAKGLDPEKKYSEATSYWAPEFVYTVGQEILVQDYQEKDDPFANGIHFFLDKEVAIHFNALYKITWTSENNNIVVICKNPIQNGTCIEYYENGAVRKEFTFSDFKVNGESRDYTKDGRLTRIYHWKDNILINTEEISGPPYI